MDMKPDTAQGARVPQVIKPSKESADILIVGNGIAGLTAAVEARRLDPGARIVMITDQNHPTINTPALKQFAVGKLTRDQLLAYPAGTERVQRLHLINGRVEEIHAQRKFVTMKGGRSFGYNTLLISTGCSPQGLPASIPGKNFDGVMTLHRLQDYLDLRRRIPEVEEAVVIGGGVHAIETAMGLVHCGVRTHWLIRGDTFMPKMLDQPASQMVLEGVKQEGMQVYTNTEVTGVVGRVGAVAGVVTNRNEMIPCQLVLCCTGTSPSEELAKSCTVPVKFKRGILVNEKLRTSVRDIYAAGDIAALPNPQSGAYETRPQWYSAVLQGRAVASVITGREEDVTDFGVPWHATLLGESHMLTVGDPLGWTEGMMTLTDNNKNSYRRMTVMGDRLVGYLSLGQGQPDSLAIKKIVDEGLPIRDVKKDLLKGTFDARKYFSQKRHIMSQGLAPSKRPGATRQLGTGSMPGQWNDQPAQRRTQELRDPERVPSVRRERELEAPMTEEREMVLPPEPTHTGRNTESLPQQPIRIQPQTKVRVQPQPAQQPAAYQPQYATNDYVEYNVPVEQRYPDTGSYGYVQAAPEPQTASPRGYPSAGLYGYVQAAPEPQTGPARYEDDFVNPFTGNLPALNRQAPPPPPPPQGNASWLNDVKAPGQPLVPSSPNYGYGAPSPSSQPRRKTTKLWSYIEDSEHLLKNGEGV